MMAVYCWNVKNVEVRRFLRISGCLRGRQRRYREIVACEGARRAPSDQECLSEKCGLDEVGDSCFTLTRLHLARFDHLQRFIQPVDVGLLKCNGNQSSGDSVTPCLPSRLSYVQKPLVVVGERHSCWENVISSSFRRECCTCHPPCPALRSS